MANLGEKLLAAVNAGGNWTTSTVSAVGPLYRNANNSRSNVNVNIGGRGSIRRCFTSILRLNFPPRQAQRLAKHANGGALGLVGTPKIRARIFNLAA